MENLNYTREQLFQFKNINDITVCGKDDGADFWKNMEDELTKKTTDGIPAIEANAQQEKTWEDDKPKQEKDTRKTL